MKALKHLFTAVLLLCGIAANAHDFEVDGIYYKITDSTNKYVGVTYKGSCTSAFADEYTGSVVIPSSVTYNNVTYSVTTIEESAFYDCTGLVNITLPKSIKRIRSYAFRGCSGLVSFTIPASVTNIENVVFYGCKSMKELIIEDSNESIHMGINSNVQGLFYDCPLETLYIGRDLAYTAMDVYGYSPFYNVASLTSVTISDNVTKIGEYLFFNCSEITEIIIPNSITSVGYGAFWNCKKLETVINFSNLTFTKGATSYGEIALYVDKVINAPNGTLEGDFVFANIDGVNTLVGYIKPFEYSVAEELATFADWNSTNKRSNSTSSKTYTINAQKDEVLVFDWAVSSEVYDKLIVTIDERPVLTRSGEKSGQHEHVFTKNGTHTLVVEYQKNGSYDVGEDMGKIFNIKLWSTKVDCEIVLPDGYKGEDYVIANNVFEDRWDFASLEIPSAVKGIGENAFKGCTNLTSITSYITAEELYAINSNVFEGVDKNECKLYVPAGAELTYATTDGWKDFIDVIAETEPSEITIIIDQCGSATYCSTYALDFSNVKGLRAYTAASYNTDTQVLTLLRVKTAKRATGLFLMGAPGEYTVPVIEQSDEYTLNMFVGTLQLTSINSKSNDGEFFNFKHTVVGENNTPEFYQFEDGSTLGANKAYLQLPASLFPAAAKSIRVRFDEGTFTDIEDVTTYNEEGVCYDLQGRAVKNPTNGFYIINGKKVLINNK